MSSNSRKQHSRRYLWAIIPLLMAPWILAQYQVFAIPFSTTAGGAYFVRASTALNELVSGYALVGAQSRLSGMAVFQYRSDGVLVTEAAESLTDTRISGRFYARVEGRVNTGIAIDNPTTTQADISYSLLDPNGIAVKTDVLSIPGQSRVTAFLNEPPFNVTGPFEGTLTFSSTKFVYVLPIRGLTNERGEFLFTTLPLTDTSYGSTDYIIPHFADGGGWTTQVLLINDDLANRTLTGSVIWNNSNGQSALVTINGQTAGAFPYSLPPGGSLRLETSGTGPDTQTGFVRVSATGFTTSPKVSILFSYRQNGITVTEAGAPANFPPYGKFAYFYGQMLGGTNDASNLPSQTGFALLNGRSAGPITATVQLTNLDGSPAGSGSLTLQSGQRVSLFLNQVPGLESLTAPFRGMVRIAAPNSDGLYALALRGTTNERGEFLLSTTPSFVVDPRLPTFSIWGGTGFPHVAFGLGYTTEFVVFNQQFVDATGQPGTTNSGSISFLGPLGKSSLRIQ